MISYYTFIHIIFNIPYREIIPYWQSFPTLLLLMPFICPCLGYLLLLSRERYCWRLRGSNRFEIPGKTLYLRMFISFITIFYQNKVGKKAYKRHWEIKKMNNFSYCILEIRYFVIYLTKLFNIIFLRHNLLEINLKENGIFFISGIPNYSFSEIYF